MHHAKAARFPVRALANYFAQTPVVRILHGGARNFDAVLYALDVQPNVAPSYHVSLRLDIDGGRLALSVLSLPIENVAGTLHVVDNAFFISGARATLAGIPLHIQGGVYDLNGAVTGGPQLRVASLGPQAISPASATPSDSRATSRFQEKRRLECWSADRSAIR